MRRRARPCSLSRASRASADGRCVITDKACTTWAPNSLIEREVQFEHVDPRFAEKAQLPALGLRVDQPPDVGLAGMPLAGDARHLEVRGRRRDVRVEARRRRRDEIDGDWNTRVLAPRGLDVGRDGFDQFLVGRAELAARRIGRVVRRAGRRGPRPEVSGAENPWPIKRDPTTVPSALDQLPVGLAGKDDLRDPRDCQWVEDTKKGRRHDRHEDGDDEIASEVHW